MLLPSKQLTFWQRGWSSARAKQGGFTVAERGLLRRKQAIEASEQLPGIPGRHVGLDRIYAELLETLRMHVFLYETNWL